MLTYDANGNRTNGSYDTDPGNRLVTDGLWTYTYDDEGNLTKKSKGVSDETWTYGFDQRNQLVWAKLADTDGGAVDLQVDFKYDAFGNRIEKAHDADGAGGGSAVVTRFALDGWKNVRQPLVGNENWDVWADLDGSNSLTTRYIRGDVIDQLFARIDGSTPYWYLTDHLGSIRDVIDGSAVIKNAMAYDGFGNITAETDSNYRGRYAWTGREIDVEMTCSTIGRGTMMQGQRGGSHKIRWGLMPGIRTSTDMFRTDTIKEAILPDRLSFTCMVFEMTDLNGRLCSTEI